MCFSSELVRKVGAQMAAGYAPERPISPKVLAIIEKKTSQEISESLRQASRAVRAQRNAH